MKKLLVLSLIAVALVGCDGQNSEPQAAQQAKQDTSQKQGEEFKFECTDNSGATECNVVAGDLLGSGEWHKAKIYMNSKNIDANIDGEHFTQVDYSNSFYEGTSTDTFTLKGALGNSAQLSMRKNKDGSVFTLEAWNKDGKRFLTATKS